MYAVCDIHTFARLQGMSRNLCWVVFLFQWRICVAASVHENLERFKAAVGRFCFVQEDSEKTGTGNGDALMRSRSIQRLSPGYTSNSTLAREEVSGCRERLAARGAARSSVNLACFRQAGCGANLMAMAPFYIKHLSAAADGGHIRNVLLVGVLRGESASVWSEYFGPQTNLVGLDINLRNWETYHPWLLRRGAFHGNLDRIKVFETDTSTLSAFRRARNALVGRVFDLIIDDGCHQYDCIMRTFTNLHPYLAKGGFYFVEDNTGILMRKFITKKGDWEYHLSEQGGKECWTPPIDATAAEPDWDGLQKIEAECKRKGWNTNQTRYQINVWKRKAF